MPTEIDILTHGVTARLTTREVVRQLNNHLGATLVATLADVRDRGLPHKWVRADGPEPRPESNRRLQAAHRAWTMISNSDNEHVARAWFIGANPRLEEQSPVERLRAGEIESVMAAANAFLSGSDD